MAAKQTLPGQHQALEYLWPNDCCLCTHEATIGDLQRQLEKAQEKLDAVAREVTPLLEPEYVPTGEDGRALVKNLARILKEENDG